ncbi:serine hydrolase [Rugosimonospora acidiphila]|uniref:Serine hydrolase n=1 Tax=Rugosimonospora acidiphila TaxID=556531 RepID=A0ABP9SSA7_9ACTN
MELSKALDSLPTTCLMVIKDGKTVYEYGDPTEVSYLASVRKSILSLLYGRPVTDGVITLQSTLEDLGIDDVQGLLPRERRATVHDLLTGRSGVYHPAASPTGLEALLPERGTVEPGTEFHYTAWDANALGTIYERQTGRRVFDAVAEDLAGPLGFQDFDPARQRLLGRPEISRHLAHHLFLSARDLARIGLLVLAGGRGLVPRQWLTQSLTPYAKNYGYQWWLPRLSQGQAFMSIGNFGQFLLGVPERDLVVVHRVAVPDELAIARNNAGADVAIQGVTHSEFARIGQLILRSDWA